jgi:hypothetical protein
MVAGISWRTGFGAGMFTAVQVAGKFLDGDEKIDFFKQLVAYTEIVFDEHVSVDRVAICQGMEVDNTLRFVQSIVREGQSPKLPFRIAAIQLRAPIPVLPDERFGLCVCLICCLIMTTLARRPMTLDCGHTICQACLNCLPRTCCQPAAHTSHMRYAAAPWPTSLSR